MSSENVKKCTAESMLTTFYDQLQSKVVVTAREQPPTFDEICAYEANQKVSI